MGKHSRPVGGWPFLVHVGAPSKSLLSDMIAWCEARELGGWDVVLDALEQGPLVVRFCFAEESSSVEFAKR